MAEHKQQYNCRNLVVTPTKKLEVKKFHLQLHKMNNYRVCLHKKKYRLNSKTTTGAVHV